MSSDWQTWVINSSNSAGKKSRIFAQCRCFCFRCYIQCLSIFHVKDNFLRGDGNRRVQHQQQRKPRKKTKPPALTKKHKKKKRRGPRRPQKPIPPALPQGNLGMPSTSIAMPSQSSIRSAALSQVWFRAYLLTWTSSICHAAACLTSSKCLSVVHTSPSTPDLSADELPDDITNEIADIPNDLELNQEDFSDVLSRLPDDLQDFDLFEGFYTAFLIIINLIAFIC